MAETLRRASQTAALWETVGFWNEGRENGVVVVGASVDGVAMVRVDGDFG